MPWALLMVGNAASLAANVAVAEPTVAGRVIAAWQSFSLIVVYELWHESARCRPLGAAKRNTLGAG
jgi:hypothetical protein